MEVAWGMQGEVVGGTGSTPTHPITPFLDHLSTLPP